MDGLLARDQAIDNIVEMPLVYVGVGEAYELFLVTSKVAARQAKQFVLLHQAPHHVARGFIEVRVPVDNEAAGHRWDEESATHVKDDIVSLPVTAPDGGLVTTLGDFLAWSRVYTDANQSVLSQQSLDRMTRQHIQIGRGGPLDAYGYGLYVGDRLIGHAGYIVGFRSFFILDRQTDTLIAVFTNNITNDPQQITFGLLDIVFADDE